MANLLSKILNERNLTLPTVKPVGSYVPAKRMGNIIVTSGQLPLKDGKLHKTGKLGDSLKVEDVSETAIHACLNGFSAIQNVTSLDKIKEVIKIGVFVASTPDFTDHHLVANHVSNFLIEIFGEEGKHARFAIGVSSLPLNAPLEVEFNVRVEEE